MKKLLAVLLLMLGITFIYNPQTNQGFVYVNDAPYHCIIMVDPSSNILTYYQGVPFFQERMDYGLNKWLQDKVQKGMPFKSVIVPYRQ